MKQTFCQFVLKQFSKNNINRMNIPTFTRVLRKKSQDVSTSQLLYVYSQLQKLKQQPPQFHTSSNKSHHHNNSRSTAPKPMLKLESYQKHTLICLQQIAIGHKQKHGFQQGADMCKLCYLRLLNLIEYNLPYANVLQQLREELLWRDLGHQIIDYVGLIEKDPVLYGSDFAQTVDIIVLQVSQQLQNIDILQLPYLKSVLSKGKTYQTYNISDQLLQRLDQIILHNRFAYSFGQLEKSLTSDIKNPTTLHYYALLNKDMMDKRLAYLYIDASNDQSLGPISDDYLEIKRQMGLPGKTFSEQHIDTQLTKIQSLSFYSSYMNVFANLHKQNQLKTIPLLRQYIKYHFKYFSHSGNLNCDIAQVSKVLSCSLKKQETPQDTSISFKHVQLVRLFFVIQMILRNPISGKQLMQSHSFLTEEMQILSGIPQPKPDHASKIFDKSTKYFSTVIDLHQIDPLISSFARYIKELNESQLQRQINDEIGNFESSEKAFVINELTIYLMSTLKNQQLRSFSQSASKILEVLVKGKFKKFSAQSLNLQKVLSLLRQSQNQIKPQHQSVTGSSLKM